KRDPGGGREKRSALRREDDEICVAAVAREYPLNAATGRGPEGGGKTGLAMIRPPASTATIDQDEIARFSRLSGQWWDPRGPMAALHKFNPVRLAYIRDRATEYFGRDGKRLDTLAGLRILDIGCGGGILSEPLARLGAAVVGADPAESNIAVARNHANAAGLSIDYRNTTAE